jgi:hydroxymethylbilane synthase
MYHSSKKLQSRFINEKRYRNRPHLMGRRGNQAGNLIIKTIHQYCLGKPLHIGARLSPLSQVQLEEVCQKLQKISPKFCLKKHLLSTYGDLDKATPLWEVNQTDFFTRELDQLLLKGSLDLAVHSAKDLPNPIHEQLSVFALTKGLSPYDCLVVRQDETLQTLKQNAFIGTSSLRRIQMIHKIRPDLVAKSIRGTIHERLNLLDQQIVDGLIMAQAALIRLKINNRNHYVLPYDVEPLQGRLAIVGKKSNHALQTFIRALFAEEDL